MKIHVFGNPIKFLVYDEDNITEYDETEEHLVIDRLVKYIEYLKSQRSLIND